MNDSTRETQFPTTKQRNLKDIFKVVIYIQLNLNYHVSMYVQKHQITRNGTKCLLTFGGLFNCGCISWKKSISGSGSDSEVFLFLCRGLLW